MNESNPYLIQLAGAVNENQRPSKAQLKEWSDLFINAFTLPIDNVIANTEMIEGIANCFNASGCKLPISIKSRPDVLSDRILIALSAQNKDAAAHLINLRFLFNVMTRGPQIALIELFQDMISPHIAQINLTGNISLIQKHKWISHSNSDTAKRIAQLPSQCDYKSDGHALACLVRGFVILVDDSNQSFDSRSLIAEKIIVPWMSHLLKKEYYDTALIFEGLLYPFYIRFKEHESHYQHAHRFWARMFEEAGAKLRLTMGPPKPMIAQDHKPVVGFFVHRASNLAHIQVLYTTLSGLKQLGDLPYRVVIYVFRYFHEDMKRMFDDIGVEIIWMDRGSNGETFQNLLEVRKRMEADGVVVLFWLCLTHMKGFAMAMGLAPRQVYWSVKYQMGAYDTPDTRAAFYDNGIEPILIDGKEWKSIPLVFTSQQHLLDTQKLQSVRDEYKEFDVILGTLAREDILNAQPFLEEVSSILEKNPKAVYLYTGRQNLPSIKNHFEARGVAHQTRFIGWVDTVVYANAIDILLDAFPARCGMTAFQTADAATPIVCYIPQDGSTPQKIFLFRMIEQQDDGIHFKNKKIDVLFDSIDNEKRFCPIVSERSQYQEMVQRLIDDAALRERTGAAFKKFAHFMSDAKYAGEALDGIIKDELEEWEETQK